MLPASDPSALRAFLEHPSRPAGTLTYHELQGFLFTVVSAPELIPVSEWMPTIFAGEDVDYASVDEVLGQIMALYNTINAAVLDPPSCSPRIARYVMTSSPISRTRRPLLNGPAASCAGNSGSRNFGGRPCQRNWATSSDRS